MIGAALEEGSTMDATELCFTPATELRELIRRRSLSPVELLDALLARVEAVDPIVHAFATLDPERARAAARVRHRARPAARAAGLDQGSRADRRPAHDLRFALLRGSRP
jgi:Asp-tRNA(Asn)/Glu-tRNA(Gln) amidotransferase A subunit family amidase